MSTSNKNTILVTGATGKTGSRIVQRLNGYGYPVRSGSRSANPKFDWTDNTTWQPALQNIYAVYIAFQPDLAVPGAVDVISSFTKTALDNGVKKLVLLSGRGELEAQQCEQVVMQSGAAFTILRASWFCQNFSENFLLEPVLAGHVALPVGNIPEPFIDVDDIADVATAALIDEKHNGQLYELTGPRLLTFKDAIGEIASVTGHTINYEQVSMPAYTSMLKEYGVPDDYIQLITYLFTEVLDGRNASLGDGVEKALGRRPVDFMKYAERTADTGIWNGK